VASQYDLDKTSGEDPARTVPEFTDAEWDMIEAEFGGDWRAYLESTVGEHDDLFDPEIEDDEDDPESNQQSPEKEE